MNDDERFLKDWLDDDAPDLSGVRTDADQIMARLPETKQRSRWWPLLPARRTQPRSSSDDSPLTINGRTRTMFSPVKAITAGALIFAIGGAFLIAQPFSQHPTEPGAETEAVAPTWVTGNVKRPQSCSNPPSEVALDVIRQHNVGCSPSAWTSSDPRFTGEVSRWWNEDSYLTNVGTISIKMDAVYLRNEGGDWTCSASDLLRGSGYGSEEATGTTYTCIGAGGYEGLSALLASEQDLNFSEEFVGLIFSGDFSPLPEPAAVE
jgi:hypothetical protein